MRTQNRKLIVPILALVPVLVLAAFLVVSSLTASGVQNAEAQGFTPGQPENALAKCEINIANVDSIDGGACTTTADSVDAIFYHTAAGAAGVRVYVTGGNDYPDVQASSIQVNSNTSPITTNAIGKKGVDQHVVDFAERRFGGRLEETITVPKSMADSNGQVFLFAYGAPDEDNDDLAAASTSLQGAHDGAIRVQFVGAPAFGEDGDDANTDIDTVEERSTVMIEPGSGSDTPTNNIDGKKDAELTLTDDASAATITVTVKDAAGQILDGEVAFTTSAQGVRISGTRHETLDDGGMASYTIQRLPAGEDDAYRIEVAIVFSNDLHTLDMGKAIINRAGEAHMIVGSVFSRACLVDTDDSNDEDETASTRYNDDELDVEDEDNKACMMDFRYGTDQMFIVKAHVEDELGNVIAGTLSVDVEDVDAPIASADEVALHDGAGATLPANTSAWLFTVDSKAAFGDHMITVSDDDDDNDVMDLVFTVAVASPPDSYVIDGPERIALGRSGTFMVQAYDKKTGIPHFDDDMPMVEVFIQGLASGNTRYITNGMIDIDPDNGMGEFIIYAPNGAMDGDTIRIFVGSGDMEVSHTVMFGMDRYPMGADIADVMMTMGDDPMMVEAMFTDAEGQDLTYEWMSSDEMVATVMADDMDMSMASITAVGPGTTMITVTATDTEGGMGMQTFMVTVEAAAPAMLTAPADVTAMSDAAGMATVRWTPGDNALGHLVFLFKSDFSGDPRVEVPSGNAYTFNDVPAGSYIAVVVSYKSASDYEYDIATVTVSN